MVSGSLPCPVSGHVDTLLAGQHEPEQLEDSVHPAAVSASQHDDLLREYANFVTWAFCALGDAHSAHSAQPVSLTDIDYMNSRGSASDIEDPVWEKSPETATFSSSAPQ